MLFLICELKKSLNAFFLCSFCQNLSYPILSLICSIQHPRYYSYLFTHLRKTAHISLVYTWHTTHYHTCNVSLSRHKCCRCSYSIYGLRHGRRNDHQQRILPKGKYVRMYAIFLPLTSQLKLLSHLLVLQLSNNNLFWLLCDSWC